MFYQKPLQNIALADADLLADLSRGSVSQSRMRAMSTQQGRLLAHALSCESPPKRWVPALVTTPPLCWNSLVTISVVLLSASPKGSDRGLLHALGASWGKRAAGEKSVGENTHSPQTAAFQVSIHTRFLSVYGLACIVLKQVNV